MSIKKLQPVIQLVSWHTHQVQLRAIREVVFIHEQAVPLAIEWDAYDENAKHLLAFLATDIHFCQPIGCARLLQTHNHLAAPVAKIGRMAVLQNYRGMGIGRALLDQAIHVHQAEGLQQIELSAQCHAVSFYEKAGFTVVSAPYQDANIPHVDMRLQNHQNT